MNEQDNLEGYCDGIAGRSAQLRMGVYLEGWVLGVNDHIEMRANDRIAGFTSIDDWLKEEGIADQVNAAAAERTRQLEQREGEGAQ